jgi:uncharacterized membrane protein YfcA
MEGWGFWVAAVAAAMLVGAGKGGIPVVGMLSVPVLSLVISPLTAAGLLLPVYVVSDMFGLWAYRKAYDGGCWRSCCRGRWRESGWVGPRHRWCRRIGSR